MSARSRSSSGKPGKASAGASRAGAPHDAMLDSEPDLFPPAPMARRPLLLVVASLMLALWVAALAWLAFTGGKLTKPPRDAAARAAPSDEPVDK